MKFRGKLLNASEVASDYFKQFICEDGSIRESTLRDHAFDCGFNDAIMNCVSAALEAEWNEKLNDEIQEIVADAFGFYDEAEGEAGEMYLFIQLVEARLDDEAKAAGYSDFAELFKDYL